MSYVQGTEVRLQADFYDTNTELPFDPAIVVLTIKPPTTAAYIRTLVTTPPVLNDTSRVGRFYYVLQTAPEPGTWRYQFSTPGPGAVVERKEITVTAALAA